MRRLRNVSPDMPGWRRVRSGRGFRYLDQDDATLPPEEVQRIRGLAIPPAWRDVWICPDDRGHLQAVGVDDAGRRQYLYHPDWRQARDAEKFDRVLSMARRLPAVRRKVRAELAVPEVDPPHVLAAAIRLVDLGCFRLGSDEYVAQHSSYGLTTLEVRHVRWDRGGVVFSFVGKAGVEQQIRVDDEQVCAMVDALTRSRRGRDRLLAVQEGRSWVPLGPTAVNDRLRELFRLDVTAKDVRTWHGTVTAAATLATARPSASARGRARQVRAAMEVTAQRLGNTPSVARSSYVDPRVVDRFEEGVTIAPALTRLPADPVRAQDALDRAVVRLLAD